MFQIVYEYEQPWPEDGTLVVKMPSISREIKVSPASARRKANGYLTCEVAMALRPGDPALVCGARPMWRMPILLQLPHWGPVATLGSVDVDALTRDVIPLTPEQITSIQAQAHAIATRLTPEAAPAS